MKLNAIKTNIFKENDNLAKFIKKNIKTLREGSVVVISSKIAALSCGRVLPGQSPAQFAKLVKKESDFYLKTALCYFTIKDGMVMTNAGIDNSNAGGKTILLPRDSHALARALRAELRQIYGVKKLGIIIADSMILPLRAGVIGAAVAHSGFKGAQSFVGKKDIFGRALEMTVVNYADALAAAATLLMGEGAQRQPLCVIENAPVTFVSKNKKGEMKYPLKQDLYYPFLKKRLKQK